MLRFTFYVLCVVFCVLSFRSMFYVLRFACYKVRVMFYVLCFKCNVLRFVFAFCVYV